MKKEKVYNVYYHRKGLKMNAWNQMKLHVQAKNTKEAIITAKKHLGENWTVEKATFDYNM